ncbi:MAG: RDD family protein [Pseudomonadota bacterium]
MTIEQLEDSPANKLLHNSCPLWRRLCAITYDSILLACVIFVLWIPVPFVPMDWAPLKIAQGLRLIYLVAVCFLFFGWFWTHGGQTLGMRSWKIRVVTNDMNPVNWLVAWRRYAASYISWLPLGAGFLWSIFDSQNRCWHDRMSSTHLIVDP